MGTVVLDSSVVLGAFDPRDAHHRAVRPVVRGYIQDGSQFLLPAVVLAEVLVREARRSRGAAEQWRDSLIDMFGPARVIDEEIATEAAHLRARHKSLRLPDALVIATGVVDDADTILTADKRWKSIDKRVEVLRPGP